MLGVGLRRILCQHVPRVTPGTRAKNYSQTRRHPRPWARIGCKDNSLLLASVKTSLLSKEPSIALLWCHLVDPGGA